MSSGVGRIGREGGERGRGAPWSGDSGPSSFFFPPSFLVCGRDGRFWSIFAAIFDSLLHDDLYDLKCKGAIPWS